VEELRLSRAEARDPQAVTQGGGERGLQLLVVGQRAGRDQRLDAGEEAGADPVDLEKLAAPDGLLEIARKGEDGAGARLALRPDVERSLRAEADDGNVPAG